MQGDLTGINSVTFADGSTAVKTTELEQVKNDLSSAISTLEQDLNGKAIQVTKRNGEITSVFVK